VEVDMCLARASIKEGAEEKLVMDGVAYMRINDGELVLRTIFGDQDLIEAHVREIDFTRHVIILERT